MSYCRWDTDSDIYLYHSIDNQYVCCGCKLIDKGFACNDIPTMLKHLDAHRAADHDVPQRAIDRLKRELENIDG